MKLDEALDFTSFPACKYICTQLNKQYQIKGQSKHGCGEGRGQCSVVKKRIYVYIT